MGDPGGIGPEVALRACCDSRVRAACAPVVVGSAALLERTACDLGLEARFDRPWSESPETWRVALSRQCEYFLAIDTGGAAHERHLGRPSKEGGLAAVSAIRQAVELSLEQYLDGIVTAPVSKQSLAAAGYGIVGHTEILAKITRAKSFAMMMKRGDLRVVLATTHLALAEVSRAITAGGLLEKISLANRYLLRFGVAKRPRIAVCALNPHAGEGGLLGIEERTKIAPAVRKARRLGMIVEGPLAADSVFREQAAKSFDAIVAMYHDQGIIPIKMGGMDAAVNVTLGLPVLRTSPAHGTAFDIAGTGSASAEGMVTAVLECAWMARAAGRRVGGD